MAGKSAGYASPWLKTNFCFLSHERFWMWRWRMGACHEDWRQKGTVEPSLSGQPLFGGKRSKSLNNCLLYTVLRTCIVARVIFFCFIPLSNGQEDLKLVVKMMAMWKRNCFFRFSSRYGQNYNQLDHAEPCFLVNLLNGQLTLLRGQMYIKSLNPRFRNSG